MIKICDSAIVEPLYLIFEKCLETGVYPTSWKRVNIIPVHKKNSRQSKNNYRPISLLPIFGKIFEKLLFDMIYKHLCDHSLITPNQSGFHPGDSTINQLLSITHTIFFFILILNITNNNITFYHTKFLITILHYRDDTMGCEKIMTTP